MMESKGKYVWDAEKQAWVRPTEPKRNEATAESAESPPETTEQAKPLDAVAETTEQAKPLDAVAETVDKESTVEATAEGDWIEYKGALIRIAGITIDVVVLLIINAIIGVIVDLVAGTETVANGAEETVTTLPGWISVIMGFVYFVGLWTWRGQTLGKMVIHAKIVKADGSRIGPINAVLRFVFYLVLIFAPILYLTNLVNGFTAVIGAVAGIVIIALSSAKQGLHDRIAGTYVVDSRPAEPLYEEVEEE